MANLHLTGMASKMYAMDNNDRYPMTLSSVATNYADVPQAFICPSSGKREGTLETVDQWSDYILVPGLTTNDPPDTILAYERLRNHKDGGNVLFFDGSVQWRTAKEYGTLKTKTGKVLSSE